MCGDCTVTHHVSGLAECSWWLEGISALAGYWPHYPPESVSQLFGNEEDTHWCPMTFTILWDVGISSFISTFCWHIFPKVFIVLRELVHRNLKIKALPCYKGIPFKPQIKRSVSFNVIPLVNVSFKPNYCDFMMNTQYLPYPFPDFCIVLFFVFVCLFVCFHIWIQNKQSVLRVSKQILNSGDLS